MRLKDNRFSVSRSAYADGILSHHSKAQFSRFLQVIYTIAKAIRFESRHATPLRRFRQQFLNDVACDLGAAVAGRCLIINGNTLARHVGNMQVLRWRWWCFSKKWKFTTSITTTNIFYRELSRVSDGNYLQNNIQMITYLFVGRLQLLHR